jgi:hypothetical protein
MRIIEPIAGLPRITIRGACPHPPYGNPPGAAPWWRSSHITYGEPPWSG